MKPTFLKSRLVPNFCYWAICGWLTVFAADKPLSAEVIVQTTDGRELTGEVDELTDGRLLWIRQRSEQIVLTTSVPWSSITAASHDGEALPLEALPELLRQQKTSEPVGFLVQQAVYHATSNCHGADCQGDCLTAAVPAKQRRRRTPRVRSLSVDAFLVNLDRDVEPDGIELVIAALDDHGVPVPVKGNLYVRLWGERIQPHGSLIQHEDLQQWNQPVVPVDFVEGVASYALRFRKVHPEFDLGLHSDALVNVRLGVFGQGNFAASVPVQIRRFNPFRDRLQLTRGSRFLPNELTEEVRHQLPRRTHTRQLRTRQFTNR